MSQNSALSVEQHGVRDLDLIIAESSIMTSHLRRGSDISIIFPFEKKCCKLQADQVL